MSTEHEARNRRAKAVALATVLHEAGAEAADIRTATFAEGAIAWVLAANLATERNLLGNGRTVHPPHSAETVAAVERELRMMQVEQRVDVEQPRTDAGRIPVLQSQAIDQDTPAERKATDSQGYRQQMRQLVPAPHTSDPFAGFPR